MTFDEYQKLAIRTINSKLNTDERLDMLTLGLSGESGEIAEAIKKWIYHSHELDEVKLSKEIGDVSWYCACVAETLHIPLDNVADTGCGFMGVPVPQPLTVESYHKAVEEWTTECATAPGPGDNPSKTEQLSSITHQLCDACNDLAGSIVCGFDTKDVWRGLADVLLTLSQYATALGRPLHQILQENVDKLKARYPEGFSEEASRNRRD